MSEEDGVGPLDFLFCEKCDQHVEDRFYLVWDAKVDLKTITAEHRDKRVAPNVQIRGVPHCDKCATRLVQKYVSININISAD